MSERGDAVCAFQMRNGVKGVKIHLQNIKISKNKKKHFTKK
jgi:hypothetical protein